MEPNTITQATSQVTTKEHALNGAQNLAQAKTAPFNACSLVVTCDVACVIVFGSIVGFDV
jgi:hypothetical protein